MHVIRALFSVTCTTRQATENIMRLCRTRQIDALLDGLHELHVPSQSKYVGPSWIDHSFLIRLSKQYKKPLRDLVSGSGVYFDPPKPPPRQSPQYVELMARLRADEKEREYRLLISESEPQTRLSSSELKEVKEQLTTILNIMVSIVAIAWAFWHWTASWDVAARTLVSLFAGIGIGIAECVVYLGYKRRVQEARKSERAAKEHRSVVKKIVFSQGVEKVIEPDSSAASLEVSPGSTATSNVAATPASSEIRSRKSTKT